MAVGAAITGRLVLRAPGRLHQRRDDKKRAARRRRQDQATRGRRHRHREATSTSDRTGRRDAQPERPSVEPQVRGGERAVAQEVPGELERREAEDARVRRQRPVATARGGGGPPTRPRRRRRAVDAARPLAAGGAVALDDQVQEERVSRHQVARPSPPTLPSIRQALAAKKPRAPAASRVRQRRQRPRPPEICDDRGRGQQQDGECTKRPRTTRRRSGPTAPPAAARRGRRTLPRCRRSAGCAMCS